MSYSEPASVNLSPVSSIGRLSLRVAARRGARA
jgi:hypothetical protein